MLLSDGKYVFLSYRAILSRDITLPKDTEVTEVTEVTERSRSGRSELVEVRTSPILLPYRSHTTSL